MPVLRILNPATERSELLGKDLGINIIRRGRFIFLRR
jgi:hypothetical protein